MAHSNDSLALTLLVDATAESARAQGQSIRGRREEETRQQILAAARRRRQGDSQAFMLVAFLAVTVLAPFLIGHFVLTKTFVLEPDPGVYYDEVRGISDHFLATYLAGLIPIAAALGLFLVIRKPWQGRMVAVSAGWIALLGSVVILLPAAQSQWHDAEQKTVAKLRETAFPFDDRYYHCASWEIHAENGIQQPELWQVHLGRLKGSDVDGCNRVNVYRGWQLVGVYNLPDGDTFTGDVVINHVGWDSPYEASGSGEVWSENSSTGVLVPMNPVATNVDLGTASGRRLNFSLDGAGSDQFELR